MLTKTIQFFYVFLVGFGQLLQRALDLTLLRTIFFKSLLYFNNDSNLISFVHPNTFPWPSCALPQLKQHEGLLKYGRKGPFLFWQLLSSLIQMRTSGD